MILLQESRTYDCSLRGVEFSALWTLEVHNEPLERIVVLLDPELQLVSARSGDSPIPWLAAPAAVGSPTRVTLRFPEPIRQGDASDPIACPEPASARSSVAAAANPSRGPLLAGREHLAVGVPEPLLADRVAPLGCGQTDVGRLSAPRVGKSMQFQSFDADATVEVLLSPRPAPPCLPDDVRQAGTPVSAVKGAVSGLSESDLPVHARHWTVCLPVAAPGADRPEKTLRPAEKSSRAASDYQVFVPIDARWNPVGGKVYVHE